MPFVVYRFANCSWEEPRALPISMHTTLDLAKLWARYYCERDNGYAMEVLDSESAGRLRLQNHFSFDRTYEICGCCNYCYFAETTERAGMTMPGSGTLLSGPVWSDSPPPLVWYEEEAGEAGEAANQEEFPEGLSDNDMEDQTRAE